MSLQKNDNNIANGEEIEEPGYNAGSKHTGSLQEGLMQYKEMKKFFSKWKKVYVILTEDKLLLKGKREDTKPFAEYPIAEFSFQEITGAGRECCVKIIIGAAQSKKQTTRGRSFILSAYSMMQFNEWIKTLQKLNVPEVKEDDRGSSVFKSVATLFPASEVPSSGRSRLEDVDAKNWSVKDVQEWLSYIRTTDGAKMAEDCGELFAENDIDGRTLLTLDDAALKSMGIKSLGRRVKILSEIEKLKQTNRYSLNEHLVFSKFERMDPRYVKDLTNLEQRVQALCDVQRIKQTYLNPSQIDMKELKQLIDEEKDEDGSSFSIVDEEEAKQHEELKLRVKLIVTEITHSDSQKSLRKILSPIAANIPLVPKARFGMFHTALIVGPWYLEWNDSSLCIPKKICSSMAIISADIDNIITPKSSDLNELVNKLSEVIVDWNCNMNYVNMKLKKKPNEGNCQDFVEAVLDKLELKPVFTGALGNFFLDMKNKGTCEMTFRPDKNFVDQFKLALPEYNFKTHEDLDQFVVDLKNINSAFQLDYPSEWGLLKSFDRAFWLRHIRYPEDEQWMPLMATKMIEIDNGPDKGKTMEERSVCACWFQDPRITHSFR